MAPHLPGHLCTVSPSTLLYVDESKSPREIHWLDCSSTEPTPIQKVISTSLEDIWEIQHAAREGLVLVMAAPGSDGIHAYNETTGELKWSVVGKPLGMANQLWPCSMAGNGKGKLFISDICDDNEAVHVFNVSDGRYVGCLIRKGEKGLKDVLRVVWCDAVKSLAVIHGGADEGCISTIQIS